MKRLLDLDAGQQAALERRLARLAADAPSGALLTVTLDLGRDDGGSDWLGQQPAATEFCYWARPAQARWRLGIGRAVVCSSGGPARFTALQAAHEGFARHWRHDDGGTDFRPVACLGFAFDDESADVLPNAQLGVAAVVLDTANGRRRASFTTPAREAHDAPARWRALLAAAGRPAQLPRIGTLPDPALPQRAWQARVDAALAAIADGSFDKVVLSRTLRLPLADDGAPVALLRALAARHPESTLFAMGNARGCLVGATPERLVGLADGVLATDALAGTAWADEPIAADKNVREQRVVVDAIRQALAPLCEHLDVPAEATVLELRDLRHLWTPIGGSTRPGVGLFDLISRLHPTPAVGGWPTAAARQWLRRHDEHRPGWYSGGVGWIDRDGNGEVAVALRCGLLTPGRIELTAGAGIVAGSLAAQEFAETEAKLGTMLDALREGDATDQRGTGTDGGAG